MSFPDVSEALWEWEDELQALDPAQSVVDYEPVDDPTEPYRFEGILEPLTAQRLLLKQEGERNWKWWTLWTETELNINAQVIDPDGITFKVTSERRWLKAGYWEYELTEATKPQASTVPT